MRWPILYVDGYAVSQELALLDEPCDQAIVSTRTTSKTTAKTETNVKIRVRLAPKIESTRKYGAKRTIDLEKDLHGMTHDQSPVSTLQWIPRTITTQTMRRAETASRFAAPRTWRHFGRSLIASGFRKRAQAIPSRMGGETTDKVPRISNNHEPSIVGEYASKPPNGKPVPELQMDGNPVSQALGTLASPRLAIFPSTV